MRVLSISSRCPRGPKMIWWLYLKTTSLRWPGAGTGWHTHVGEVEGNKMYPPTKCLFHTWVILSWKESWPKRLRKKLWPSPWPPKECRQRACPGRGAVTIDGCRVSQWCRGRDLAKSVKIPLCGSPSRPTQQTSVYQIFAFLSSCQLPDFPLRSQTATPNILLYL